MSIPNPLLSGAFEPLGAELDLDTLAVDGELPADLEGVLYRIGPNPQFDPIAPYNPLQGEGMVHAFRIGGGRVAYRNRWVRTRRWMLEREAGRALFATTDPRLSDPSVAGVDGQGAANTHVVAHGGRLLALEEGHPPIALDPDTLETLGPCDFDGRLQGPMTAHPRICPRTGEMLAFTNLPSRAFDGALAIFWADAGGRITRAERIAGPYPALVHDFAITADHLVFVVCPLTISLQRLRAGGPPVAWEPALGAWVGLMRRTGPAEVRWLPAPTAMVWHLMNAFEDEGGVQLDLCRQEAPAFPSAGGAPPPESALRQHLARWTVHPTDETPITERRLSEVVCEYPRIDERRTGASYRYGYVAAEGGPGTGDLPHRALGRYDHHTGEMRLWRAPAGNAVSEPVFAPRPGSADEGDGWLLATVCDEHRPASFLAVFDAKAVEAGPIARAHLGHRVPLGFHGSWVAKT